jgi:two-component system, OmpR family, alkaline phosphatase synthesis response regulator PhoP
MPRQKPRILIVEDEQHIGVTLKFNCDAEGYDCTLIEEGPRALAIIEHERDDLDLVILDLMLPGMSGYAVLEKMRDANIQIPVLILSARTLSEDKIRGWNAGADGYLTVRTPGIVESGPQSACPACPVARLGPRYNRRRLV